MKPRLLATAFALAATLTGTLARANVIVVTPTGIPSTIQGAVDVAVDGDVILVETGVYPSFVIRNKELTVVANTGAIVKIDGAIRVGNLSATRTVVISGLENKGTFGPALSGRYGLRVVNCAGLVLVQDCTLKGIFPPVAGQPTVLIEHSLGVVLSRCAITAPQGDLDAFGDPLEPGVAARVTDSSASFYSSTFTGGQGATGDGGPVYGYGGGSGGSAVVGQASNFFVSGSAFQGGRGGGGWHPEPTGDGGDAVALQSCAWINAGSTLAGGFPGFGIWVPAVPVSPLGDVGGTLTGSGISSATLSGPARSVLVPALARENTIVAANFLGAPMDAVTRLSSRTGCAIFDRNAGTQITAFGRTYRASQIGTCNPSGSLSTTISVPDLGGDLSRVLLFQGRHAGTGGELRFGEPRALIMLDSAF